jgi:hypothetical protein
LVSGNVRNRNENWFYQQYFSKAVLPMKPLDKCEFTTFFLDNFLPYRFLFANLLPIYIKPRPHRIPNCNRIILQPNQKRVYKIFQWIYFIFWCT